MKVEKTEDLSLVILDKFIIQALAVMGNEIPRTEAIKTNSDNGAKGGVNDTTDDRGDDRDQDGDQDGVNKCSAGMKNWRQSLQKPTIVNKE